MACFVILYAKSPTALWHHSVSTMHHISENVEDIFFSNLALTNVLLILVLETVLTLYRLNAIL